MFESKSNVFLINFSRSVSSNADALSAFNWSIAFNILSASKPSCNACPDLVGSMKAASSYLPSQSKMDSIRSSSPVDIHFVPSDLVCSSRRLRVISPLSFKAPAGNNCSNGSGNSWRNKGSDASKPSASF